MSKPDNQDIASSPSSGGGADSSHSDGAANWLLDIRRTVDRYYTLEMTTCRNPILTFFATVISYAITKALQQGGWDLYYSPNTNRTEIQRRTFNDPEGCE